MTNPSESSELLRRQAQEDQIEESANPRRRTTAFTILGCVAVASVLLFAVSLFMKGNHEYSKDESFVATTAGHALRIQNVDAEAVADWNSPLALEAKKKKKKKKKKEDVQATRRCDWVVGLFTEKYSDTSEEDLRVQYPVQAKDANVFYRATANIFWIDFVENGWGERVSFDKIGIKRVHADGTPLQRKSTWTWVTGDQHLSNFGAWRNRHGDVVFGVNDFDEAAIYDFQVDVLRIAVSVCSHAYTNGLSRRNVKDALRAFSDTYVETVTNYVGGDRELLYELTPKTATGSLKAFLEELAHDKSSRKQLQKFTEMDGDGNRRFIRDDKTRLVEVDLEVVEEIREAFTIQKFGATMMKMGWHVVGWDDDFFEVLDVAARVRTGVGSYGVDRYYVLLRGTDGSLEDGADGNAVILDVKNEPAGAVAQVLTNDDAAWYANLFANDAARAVEGQRRLTSYVDPFTGWVVLDGEPCVVRQRSPWKDSPDLDALTDPDDFINFMEQIAVATATSHCRGTVSKSPGQFKHVIASVLGHWADRRAWGETLEKVANEYREQVLLDFQCFKEYVDENYN